MQLFLDISLSSHLIITPGGAGIRLFICEWGRSAVPGAELNVGTWSCCQQSQLDGSGAWLAIICTPRFLSPHPVSLTRERGKD